MVPDKTIRQQGRDWNCLPLMVLFNEEELESVSAWMDKLVPSSKGGRCLFQTAAAENTIFHLPLAL